MKNYLIILIAFSFVACSKSSDAPENEGGQNTIWIPQKSQPQVFKVPEELKNNTNQYAKSTYEGIKELEDLITAYKDYFLVPEGTKNESLTGNKFSYGKDGLAITYTYEDYSSTHRTFNLVAKQSSGEQVVRISGDWWENWNAEEGKTETGKHYGNLRYQIGDDSTGQTKEFSWKDDGGENYRVTYSIWRPGVNSGLSAKYEYTFNADLSGNSSYREHLPNGGGEVYNAGWKKSGSGQITIGESGNAVTHNW